ncbi:hypothetical protein LINPERHAP1_LOCUS17651 [Linum perenne]
MMEERVFGCGVLAYPHMKSRLKILKSKFVAYQLCKGQSGWGWDDVAKFPIADKEIFDIFVKVWIYCSF